MDSSQAESQIHLLASIARRDQESRDAFRRLYRATLSRVWGICLAITRNPADAEEATNDTYLKVWREAGSYTPTRGGPLAWLAVIARSKALDVLRKRGRDRLVLTEDGPWAVFEAPPTDCLETLKVARLLQTLEESDRRLILASFFLGCTHGEMAEATGLPLGTVKSRIRRAIEKLKELWRLEDEHE